MSFTDYCHYCKLNPDGVFWFVDCHDVVWGRDTIKRNYLDFIRGYETIGGKK